MVEGNQIGMIGPSTNGLYARSATAPRGSWSTARATPSAARARGANVISGNGGAASGSSGRPRPGTSSPANLIGLAPGGGYLFGTGNPGNGGDGVRIEDSAQNQVGGPDSTWGNAISSNAGAGVFITGASATGNTVLNNLIGLTADGTAVKGNSARRRGRVLAPERRSARAT